ncbi:pentatricopeptide repeat-containing protein At3g05340 [Fagus crenata]
MKSRWVFHKLSSQLPSWVSTLLSPFKTQTHQNPFSGSSKFVLDHADISLLLSICGKQCLLHLGSSIHASIIKNFEFLDPDNRVSTRSALFVWNSLLFMYSKCGELSNAVKMFDHMPMKDTVSWNTVMSGFLRNGEFDMGFGLFKRMRESGLYQFDKATLTTILSACEGPEFCYVSKMIHGLVILNGYEHEITVGNALITSYFKCGCFCSGRRVFDEMLERNVITWTAVISGLAQNEFYEESLKLFAEMRCGSVDPNPLTYLSFLMACSGLQALSEGCQIHGLLWKLGIQSDLCIESSLMDMYSKCGSVEDAWRIFESAEELDEVSMTVILLGFAQNGFEVEAIQIFVKIVKSGIEVDPDMVSAVLGAFGDDTSLVLGTQIHALVIKKNFSDNTFVSNGLINMYSKCGDLEDSIKVFSQIMHAQSGNIYEVLAELFRHMTDEGYAPDKKFILYYLDQDGKGEPLGIEASTSGDTYDFGIMLLEMMTQKKPTRELFPDGLDLRKRVASAFPKHIMDVVGASLSRRHILGAQVVLYKGLGNAALKLLMQRLCARKRIHKNDHLCFW